MSAIFWMVTDPSNPKRTLVCPCGRAWDLPFKPLGSLSFGLAVFVLFAVVSAVFASFRDRFGIAWDALPAFARSLLGVAVLLSDLWATSLVFARWWPLRPHGGPQG